MVHRCCISSCGMNVRVAEAKGLSYHTFPLKEPQREKWLDAVLPHIDRPSTFKVVQGYTRICSRHFSRKDYSLDSKKRARLSSNAVPSIFPEKGSPLIVENILESVRTSTNESSSAEEQDKENSDSVALVQHESANNIDSELLLSIQAVNINSIESQKGNAPIQVNPKPETQTSWESEAEALQLNQDLNPDFEESLLSALRLDDMISISAFNGSTNGTNLADNKPRLFDFTSSFLENENCDLSSSIFDSNDLLPDVLHEHLGFVFNNEDILSTEFQSISTASETVPSPSKTAALALVQNKQEKIVSSNDSSCSTDSTSEVKESAAFTERRSPIVKRNKRRKTYSPFSADRFCDSDKDIEYYTGFSTYPKFEAFFEAVQTYALKLKAEMEAKRMVSLISSSTTHQTEDSSDASKEEVSSNAAKEKSQLNDILECVKIRGGSLSRFDELFVTIMRLKRKLPEKVLGHMFCISQPAVSRIVRRWTSLLFKFLEVTSQTIDANANTKMKNAETETLGEGDEIEIPNSLRQLIRADMAKAVGANGRSTPLSRKTSSTTNCHNTSKSKRPKKEKSSTNLSVDFSHVS